jgi:rSAM/selenodomain-associated transferase 1
MILFAKAPVVGNVKTRLQAQLGAEATLALHEAFVLDTLDKLLTLVDLADIELHTDIATDAWNRPLVTRKTQALGDLGLKMLHALSPALAEGRERVCVVGSDAPTLPAEHLRSLFSSRADVALGPCEDGGYYAICCRRTHASMFRGVEWSSELTLAQTEASARACGLTVELGPAWYDVDRPEDLLRLQQDANLPTRVSNWFARCSGSVRSGEGDLPASRERMKK